MAQEIIDSIRDAEQRSQQAIKDAEEKSRLIRENAYKEVKNYEDRVVSEAKAAVAERMREVESTRSNELEAARRRAMAIIAQKKVGGEERKTKAIEYIISKIC